MIGEGKYCNPKYGLMARAQTKDHELDSLLSKDDWKKDWKDTKKDKEKFWPTNASTIGVANNFVCDNDNCQN